MAQQTPRNQVENLNLNPAQLQPQTQNPKIFDSYSTPEQVQVGRPADTNPLLNLAHSLKGLSGDLTSAIHNISRAQELNRRAEIAQGEVDEDAQKIAQENGDLSGLSEGKRIGVANALLRKQTTEYHSYEQEQWNSEAGQAVLNKGDIQERRNFQTQIRSNFSALHNNTRNNGLLIYRPDAIKDFNQQLDRVDNNRTLDHLRNDGKRINDLQKEVYEGTSLSVVKSIGTQLNNTDTPEERVQLINSASKQLTSTISESGLSYNDAIKTTYNNVLRYAKESNNPHLLDVAKTLTTKEGIVVNDLKENAGRLDTIGDHLRTAQYQDEDREWTRSQRKRQEEQHNQHQQLSNYQVMLGDIYSTLPPDKAKVAAQNLRLEVIRDTPAVLGAFDQTAKHITDGGKENIIDQQYTNELTVRIYSSPSKTQFKELNGALLQGRISDTDYRNLTGHLNAQFNKGSEGAKVSFSPVVQSQLNGFVKRANESGDDKEFELAANVHTHMNSWKIAHPKATAIEELKELQAFVGASQTQSNAPIATPNPTVPPAPQASPRRIITSRTAQDQQELDQRLSELNTGTTKTLEQRNAEARVKALQNGTPFQEDFGFGKRTDGTPKGLGYFGKLPRIDDKTIFSTELEISVDVGGRELSLPLLVPTLTKQELDVVLSTSDITKIPDTIVNKAIKHGLNRIKQGKSPFAGPTEQQTPPKK